MKFLGFTYPEAYPDPETSFTRSLFWPSEGTFHGHPRFKTLTKNIRERRGEKVNHENLFTFRKPYFFVYIPFLNINENIKFFRCVSTFPYSWTRTRLILMKQRKPCCMEKSRKFNQGIEMINVLILFEMKNI